MIKMPMTGYGNAGFEKTTDNQVEVQILLNSKFRPILFEVQAVSGTKELR